MSRVLLYSDGVVAIGLEFCDVCCSNAYVGYYLNFTGFRIKGHHTVCLDTVDINDEVLGVALSARDGEYWQISYIVVRSISSN